MGPVCDMLFLRHLFRLPCDDTKMEVDYLSLEFKGGSVSDR